MAGQSKEASIPPWGLAVAGATGAVIANALVYPLDMCVYLSRICTSTRSSNASTMEHITTRQQTQKKGERKGMLDTAKDVIHSEDGWTGLWRGLKASLVLVVNPAITYGAYQRLREVIYPGKLNLRPGEAFLLGAISKSLATIVTQPLIVAKVGMQSKPPVSRKGKPFKSFVEVMQFIIQNEGLLGLFKGIGPQITKGLLVQGLLMMTKERMELVFILLYRYMRKLRDEKLAKVAEVAAAKTKVSRPLVTS
ncbi:hypothetical protein BUE80_DR013533 [Diplocarpon rosae]|nr:hypothetical protein BUE80_DR013533 [Diplocarpon rosae]